MLVDKAVLVDNAVLVDKAVLVDNAVILFFQWFIRHLFVDGSRMWILE